MWRSIIPSLCSTEEKYEHGTIIFYNWISWFQFQEHLMMWANPQTLKELMMMINLSSVKYRIEKSFRMYKKWVIYSWQHWATYHFSITSCHAQQVSSTIGITLTFLHMIFSSGKLCRWYWYGQPGIVSKPPVMVDKSPDWPLNHTITLL